MKAVCRKRCQVRNKSKIIFAARGDVLELDKEHPCFDPLVPNKIDFATAGEQELLEAEYELGDLKDFIKEKFDHKAGNRGKEKTVALMLDLRMREVDVSDITVEGMI